jgi:hypothetical protein
MRARDTARAGGTARASHTARANHTTRATHTTRARGPARQDQREHDHAAEGERGEDEGVRARGHAPKLRPKVAGGA